MAYLGRLFFSFVFHSSIHGRGGGATLNDWGKECASFFLLSTLKKNSSKILFQKALLISPFQKRSFYGQSCSKIQPQCQLTAPWKQYQDFSSETGQRWWFLVGLGQGGSEKPILKIFYRASCQIYGLEGPVGQHPPGPTRSHFRGNFI